MPTRDLVALARFHAAQRALRKSTAPQPKLQLTASAASRRDQPPATEGGFVRIQRPDRHPEPILARVVATGKDGISAMDDHGTLHKVRHAHVVDRDARLTAQERATFTASQMAAGVPHTIEERFLQLSPQGQAVRRPSASQLELLAALTAHGVPVDQQRVADHASFDDVERILQRYVSDPAGRIGKPASDTRS